MVHQFCYWDVCNQVDGIIFCCYLAASLTILFVTSRRIRVLRQYCEKGGSRIVKLYILILLWTLTFSFQRLIGISVYFIAIK